MAYARERLPANWKGGLTPAEVEAGQQQRPRHTQTVMPTDRKIGVFEHAQFIAHLDRELRYGKMGEMIVQFNIPYQFAYLAEPLAFSFGLPLSVDVQLWEPFRAQED